MNLYFITAEDEDGSVYDLHVSASSAQKAVDFWNSYFGVTEDLWPDELCSGLAPFNLPACSCVARVFEVHFDAQFSGALQWGPRNNQYPAGNLQAVGFKQYLI
jgi:hypothetical protein